MDEPVSVHRGQSRSLLPRGNKSEAIKVYCTATGVELAKARAVIEAIAAGH